MAKRKPSTQFGIIRSLFVIDARSLATLRILIAAIIFVQALFVFKSLGPIDSASAAVSTESVLNGGEVDNPQNYFDQTAWSLLWLSDSNFWKIICAAVNVLAAISLCVGFQTFVATAICLVMSWSFQVAGLYEVAWGHELLRLVLFWGLFLPLGSCWSIDSRKYSNPRPAKWSVVSFGTVGIMLQLAYVYFFSGLRSQLSGIDGVSFVQNVKEQMNFKLLGDWLVEHPVWLEKIFPVLLMLQIVGVVLVFVPFIQQFWRGVIMALVLLSHLGIGLAFSAGIFPAVAAATWIIFVPGSVWNGILGRPNQFERDMSEEFVSLRRVWQCVCFGFIVFVLVLNINMAVQPRDGEPSEAGAVLTNVANITMTQQQPGLFANRARSKDSP